MLRRIKNWVLVTFFHEPAPGLYDEVDPRNFGAKVLAGEAKREELTDQEFSNITPMRLIDQKSSDFCVGASKSYAKEATEGVRMSWPGAFALGCRAQGFIAKWGISILQVMKGAVKWGTPEEKLWPYTGNRSHDADWKKMDPIVLANAQKHKDGSFFMIEPQSGWDRFDLFRAYLWKLREKKVVIQTGANGHAITLIGQKMFDGELRLYGPDSYGEHNRLLYRLGKVKDGYRYFTRPEVNQMFNGYIGLDMERSLAELLVEYDGKAVKLEDSPECYLVKEGKRHYLKNEAIAWAHNTLLFGENYVFVLTEAEFNKIPNGDPAKFEDGPNKDIILRILEKTGQTHLISL